MTLAHIRAVEKHAKTSDTLGRFVLVTIAGHIGYDGSNAYCGVRSIAERVGCHRNTVTTKIEELEAAGDLVVIRKGHGKGSEYNIPFEVDGSYDTISKSVTLKEEIKEEVSQQVSQAIEQLSQQLSQSIEKLSQQLSQTVTIKTVTEEEDNEDNEEEETHAHANERFVDMWQSEPISTIEQKYIEAVKSVVCNPQDIQNIRLVATEAIGYDLEPEDIKTLFGENSYWYKVSFGRDGKPPYVRNVLNELRGAVIWLRNNPDFKPENSELTAKAKEDFRLFAELQNLSRQEQSERLRSLPDYLKRIYNTMSTEWRKTPNEKDFITVYPKFAPQVAAHD